jgi:hypothetical protein
LPDNALKTVAEADKPDITGGAVVIFIDAASAAMVQWGEREQWVRRCRRNATYLVRQRTKWWVACLTTFGIWVWKVGWSWTIAILHVLGGDVV